MVKLPGLPEIRRATERLSPYLAPSPLIRLEDPVGDARIYLKLENLQPVGAFKLRCMGNAVLAAGAEAARRGVYTASSGNAGLGLAWVARRLGIAATVYAPDTAPAGKLDAVRALGARVEVLAFDAWWNVIEAAAKPGETGIYIDAVRSPAALAGNATVGLEIAAQLPDVDTVLVPFGGGGIACGVAAALRHQAPAARVVVAECETAEPLGAAFEAGEPVTVPTTDSFISGAGSPRVLDEMWPLIRQLIDGTVSVPLAAVAEAIHRLFHSAHVVAEGAGALPVAAALSGRVAGDAIVCVVTGGNLETADMITVLRGEVPGR